MSGYILNLETETVRNSDYRRVVYTGRYSQLVLMSLKPGVEIGNEIHGLDQFIRIEQGQAQFIFNNGEKEETVTDGFAVIVPAGTWHNVINTGEGDLKLYTVYSPPAHELSTVQPTKADEVEDHFNGISSEDASAEQV
ncbi:MAG: cupin domain-containing protein [Candidatus Pacebacteria bacterium CG_4_10_14_0_8_um_filter_43_12]|nr:MAG: cupin domain-containing protein [Candidatus Pacebacteria bacterium CG_4_10_14_0_8_um_filter_43_12]